ncbi:hypothetical protein N9O26_02270 [Flavobacteriaceae bacterium]|nr:hypothetical protein [Flavobacteriaceae bacterium]
MTKVNNFWVPKVDSLELRILLSEVEIIDTTLIDNLITYAESTGEFVKERKGEKVVITTPEGLTFGYNVRKRKAHPESPEILTQIYILANAKHLKERYFEGITMDNVQILLDAINSTKTIKISREALLRADITDVDFCIDFPATYNEFKEEVVDRLYKMVLTKKADRVPRPYRTKTNLGLQLNHRDKSTPAKTYAKFYHKTTELINNSADFAETYLKGIDYTNIGRFEFNLKNRDYLRHYGMHGIISFKQLLQFETAQTIFQDVYSNWFVQREFKPTSSERWYLIKLEECYKAMNLGQINTVKENAIARCKSEKQIRNIRKNYHMNMKDGRLKVKAEEYQQKCLASQLDLFFGVNKKPTYDVGTLPPKTGGLDNIIIDENIPY